MTSSSQPSRELHVPDSWSYGYLAVGLLKGRKRHRVDSTTLAYQRYYGKEFLYRDLGFTSSSFRATIMLVSASFTWSIGQWKRLYLHTLLHTFSLRKRRT